MKQFIVLSILLILSNCTPSIEQINRSVNKVPYKVRIWTSDDDFYRYGGMCHDYAYVKARELIRHGYGKSEFKIVTIKDSGVRHMVLIHNGKVLDNLSDKVEPLEYLNRYELEAK